MTARAPVPRGPLPNRDPTLKRARREMVQINRARVQLDVVRTLRAVEHVRARWRSGAAIEPETTDAIFESVIAILDDVSALLVVEMAADEAEAEIEGEKTP